MNHYLVTGAASGIGRALTQQLLEAGHEVTGWDRSAEGVAGSNHRQLDLTDFAEVSAAAAELPRPLSGLANVAGVPGTAPASAVLAVNVRATKEVVRQVLPQVMDGGAIITVASIAGLRSAASAAELDLILSDTPVIEVVDRLGFDGAQAYDASKKALLRWNSRLVAELLGRRIRACTVSPGPVDTPILDDFVLTMGDSVHRAAAALGGHASAEQVAAAVGFLLTPAARWVNGVDLRVDGGLIALSSAHRQVSGAAQ